MLSRVNGTVWMEDEGEEDDAISWTRNSIGGGGGDGGGVENKDDMGSLSTFKSLLEEDDWYVNSNNNGAHHDFQSIQQNHHHQEIRDIAAFSSNPAITTTAENLLLLQSVDSSSSCSPSSAFNLDPSSSQQVQSFLPPKSALSSLLSAVCNNNPFDNNNNNNGFDLSCEPGFLMGNHHHHHQTSNSPVSMNNNNNSNRGGSGILNGFNGLNSQGQMGGSTTPDHLMSSNSQFGNSRLIPWGSDNSGCSVGTTTGFNPIGGGGGGGFGGFESPTTTTSLFLNRSKMLRPLDIFPPVGAQPTLFQKRAALRQNSADKGGGGGGGGGNLGVLSSDSVQMISNRLLDCAKGKREMEEQQEKWRRNYEDDDLDEGSIDGSGLNYDTDEAMENNNNKVGDSLKNGGNNSNANSSVTGGGGGDQKGKKKGGLPAKNLMAERRRRKKLNDRLYMLRSVVPKISKMDRASILGDAIEYLKELLQRIKDIHNELESTPPGSSLPPTSSFHPLTPTPPTLPCRVKEELCQSSLPSPNSQPARVEVRVREGRAVNIHMFCARRPGLLLSTMRALDGLGIDIQQAVISCFNGFALDVFRAEQCNEGLDVPPEEIKAVLLNSAGFHGMM